MRIGVLSYTQKSGDRPERYVSKNAAAALLRRLLAIRLTKNLIQMVAIRSMCRATPALTHSESRYKAVAAQYQHHIEPRINHFTITSSEWLRYLHGYQQAR